MAESVCVEWIELKVYHKVTFTICFSQMKQVKNCRIYFKEELSESGYVEWIHLKSLPQKLHS